MADEDGCVVAVCAEPHELRAVTREWGPHMIEDRAIVQGGWGFLAGRAAWGCCCAPVGWVWLFLRGRVEARGPGPVESRRDFSGARG